MFDVEPFSGKQTISGYTYQNMFEKGWEKMRDIDNKVGFRLHKLDMEMKKLMDTGMRAAGYDEVTLTHGWILKYLYDNRDQEIYQRDIEKHFALGRSTVTTIIQLMEKRDLVCRESVEWDARLKKVMLTEKGYQHHDHVVANISGLHKKMMVGISREEKERMLEIIDKISGNISDCKPYQNTLHPTKRAESKEV